MVEVGAVVEIVVAQRRTAVQFCVQVTGGVAECGEGWRWRWGHEVRASDSRHERKRVAGSRTPGSE
jgi:hypothetical protein